MSLRSRATQVVYLGSVAKANERGVDSFGALWFSAIMPIYEYTPADCESPFEELVRSAAASGAMMGGCCGRG